MLSLARGPEKEAGQQTELFLDNHHFILPNATNKPVVLSPLTAVMVDWGDQHGTFAKAVIRYPNISQGGIRKYQVGSWDFHTCCWSGDHFHPGCQWRPRTSTLLGSLKVSLPFSTVVLSSGDSGILPLPGNNKANTPWHQWRSQWDTEFPSSPSINEEDKWERQTLTST